MCHITRAKHYTRYLYAASPGACAEHQARASVRAWANRSDVGSRAALRVLSQHYSPPALIHGWQSSSLAAFWSIWGLCRGAVQQELSSFLPSDGCTLSFLSLEHGASLTLAWLGSAATRPTRGGLSHLGTSHRAEGCRLDLSSQWDTAMAVEVFTALKELAGTCDADFMCWASSTCSPGFCWVICFFFFYLFLIFSPVGGFAIRAQWKALIPLTMLMGRWQYQIMMHLEICLLVNKLSSKTRS